MASEENKSGGRIARLFGETPAEAKDTEVAQQPPFFLNQIIFSNKRAKNQLLTSIVYQAIKPTYSTLDPKGDYSTDPEDLPHIEILFMDNCGDFCFETLKKMIQRDLTQMFKDTKKMSPIKIVEFTCTILDKIIIQQSFSLKEFMFNLKKCNIYLKRHPGIRLVVIDSLNTFFLTEFSRYNQLLISKEIPKKRPNYSLLEMLVLREISTIAQNHNLKILFTTVEYFIKRSLKYENQMVVIEDHIAKYLSYPSSPGDLAISSLYLVNPVVHWKQMKSFLLSMEVELQQDGADADCIMVIQRKNISPDYLVRAVKIDKGDISMTPTKKAYTRLSIAIDQPGIDD